VVPQGNHAANEENKNQPDISCETGLLDSKQGEYKTVVYLKQVTAVRLTIEQI
jgi:hypothetical protein